MPHVRGAQPERGRNVVLLLLLIVLGVWLVLGPFWAGVTMLALAVAAIVVR